MDSVRPGHLQTRSRHYTLRRIRAQSWKAMRLSVRGYRPERCDQWVPTVRAMGGITTMKIAFYRNRNPFLPPAVVVP